MADTVPEKTADKGGSFFKKHKAAVIVVGVIIAGVFLYFIMRSNASNAAATNNPYSTNPNLTGTTPFVGGGSIPGPRGVPGPRGQRGPRGPKGPGPRRHKKHKKQSVTTGQGSFNPAFGIGQFATVNSGETAGQFAMRHNLTTGNLAAMNPNTSSFHAGQRVRVR